jgi:hypothetical protein
MNSKVWCSHKPEIYFFIKNAIFWDVALCEFITNRCFVGTCHLHLYKSVSYRLTPFLAQVISSILKMAATHSSKTPIYNKPTWHHIP